MHDSELALETEVSARLITRRFPELRREELRPVSSTGTVNRIIRVGDGLVARFPRLAASEPTLAREAAALDELAAAGDSATTMSGSRSVCRGAHT